MIVSIITPAFEARGTLERAYRSILAAGHSDFEWVITSDDGRDYQSDLPNDPRMIFTDIGPLQTGPGPTRNRALAAATGDVVAYLDADDTWEAGYLAALLPLVSDTGLAFGRTRVMVGEGTLVTFPVSDRDQLALEDFGETGASFHPVLKRELAREMVNRPSQDIRHAVEVLARNSGTAPLAGTPPKSCACSW